jgi:hypothetical protein
MREAFQAEASRAAWKRVVSAILRMRQNRYFSWRKDRHRRA